MIRSGLKHVYLLAAVCGLALPAAAQVPPTETLVPTTTQYWLSIPVVDEATKEWNKTELGKLMDDPIMKPAREDLNAQTKKRREDQGNVLGIDWDDLKSMAGGELLFGVAGFAPLIRQRAVDVIMPDVKHCGGLLELTHIAAAAAADNVVVAPHNPSGPVSTAASVQACAGIANVTATCLELLGYQPPDDLESSLLRFR